MGAVPDDLSAELQVAVGAGPQEKRSAARGGGGAEVGSPLRARHERRERSTRPRAPARQWEGRGGVADHLDVRAVVAHEQAGAPGHGLDDHRVGPTDLGGHAHDAAAVDELAVAVAEDVAGEAHVRAGAALRSAM